MYFFTAGQGVEDINDALEGSLTYQPSEPTENLDIVVSMIGHI